MAFFALVLMCVVMYAPLRIAAGFALAAFLTNSVKHYKLKQ